MEDKRLEEEREEESGEMAVYSTEGSENIAKCDNNCYKWIWQWYTAHDKINRRKRTLCLVLTTIGQAEWANLGGPRGPGKKDREKTNGIFTFVTIKRCV